MCIRVSFVSVLVLLIFVHKIMTQCLHYELNNSNGMFLTGHCVYNALCIE